MILIRLESFKSNKRVLRILYDDRPLQNIIALLLYNIYYNRKNYYIFCLLVSALYTDRFHRRQSPSEDQFKTPPERFTLNLNVCTVEAAGYHYRLYRCLGRISISGNT